MSFLNWFKQTPTAAAVSEVQSEGPRAVYLKREFAGHPSRGLTPATLAYALQAAELGDLVRQAELFMDMEEKDAHLSAELSKRKMAVKKLEWSLQPPSNPSAREKKATAALEALLRDGLNLDQVRADMLDAIGHGYSCLELTWGRNRAGVWLPESIDHRSPTWFTVPRTDRTVLHLRDGTAWGAPLQPFSWIPHLHQARSGYLPRTGLHRVLAWPYLFKNYSVRDLAEFLDVYGLPVRIGRYPASTDPAAKADLMNAVLSIGHHAAGIIPDSMQIELSNVMASGNADGFRTMIDWCEASQSKAILGGTLTSQAGTIGSHALGNVHNEVRLDIRDDDARQIDQSLSLYLVYPVAVLNGWFADDRCPRFVSDTQEPDDLALYAEALPKLAAAGAVIPVRYVSQKLKIPEREGDEPILGGAAAATGAADAVPVAGLAALAAANEVDPTPVSAQADLLAAVASDALTGMLATVRVLVERAESLEGLQADLLNAYGALESESLTQVMALAFAAADLSGRFDVRGGG